MKTIVGVDTEGIYTAALDLVQKLEIRESEIELVHIEDQRPFLPDQSFTWTPELIEIQEQFDKKIMHEAEEAAEHKGLHSETFNFIGSPAGTLIEQADEMGADLIAIGSHRRSRLAAVLFGSVGRALIIGAHKSVLIAKNPPKKDGKLSAVMTTDHSPYSDEAVKLLLRLKPLGIGKLTILTVIDQTMVYGSESGNIESLTEKFNARGQEIARLLTDQGIPTECTVRRGDLEKVIDQEMDAIQADLLIMAAQGHGFLERLFIGSTSLREAMTSPHSVLILRPEIPVPSEKPKA